jgi:hypothetical protein
MNRIDLGGRKRAARARFGPQGHIQTILADVNPGLA